MAEWTGGEAGGVVAERGSWQVIARLGSRNDAQAAERHGSARLTTCENGRDMQRHRKGVLRLTRTCRKCRSHY
jgi:hypothetical protein